MNDVALQSSTASVTSERFSIWDLLGVFILPFVCFAVDFRIGGLVVVTLPGTAWAFALTGIGAFVWSLFLKATDRVAPFVSGMLAAAGLGALIIGALLFPFSLVAIAFAGLGFLGFIPFLTAWRFLKRSQGLFKGRRGLGLCLLGVVAAMLPAFMAFAAEIRADEQRHADLMSGDPQRVLKVLQGTRIYGIRELAGHPSFPETTICEVLDRLPTGDPAVKRALGEFVGAHTKSLEDQCNWILYD
jgi:hypothetical protein